MATKTLMSREGYLETGFDNPEPEFVEGELVERPMPNMFHSRVQTRLVDAFKPWEDRRELFRATEIRLLVANRFRVADFAVFRSEQHEASPTELPYLVVEIVSPDDRYEDLMIKLADYADAGIEQIFVADPRLRTLSRYDQGSLIAVVALDLPVHKVSIPLNILFTF